MKPRILYILFICLIAFSQTTFADSPRPGENRRDAERWRKEMQEFKLKFLAQEMGLRDDQQKQFFTIYNQMTEEKDALMRSSFQTVDRVERDANASEADYRNACEVMRKTREQELAIDKKYDDKFKTFLSQKQIFKMKSAERKFREKLQKMRHNHKNHNRPPKR